MRVMCTLTMEDHTLCCSICSLPGDDNRNLVHVTEKGIETLLKSCNKKKDKSVRDNIEAALESVYVHADCRKAYTDPRKFKKRMTDVAVKSKRIKLSSLNFDYKSSCFYCSKPIYLRSSTHAYSNRKPYRSVATLETKQQVLDKCSQRSDEWADEVRTHVLNCIDLVAAEAIYHVDCAARFFSGKPKSLVCGSGWSEDCDKAVFFSQTCEWLESNMDLIKLNEAYEYMVNLAGKNEVYTSKRFKQKLKDKYKDNLTFHESPGCSPVIYFTNLTSKFINDFYSRK